MNRSRGVTIFAAVAIVYGFVTLAGQALFWTGVAFEQIEPSRLHVAVRIVALALGCALFGGGCGALAVRNTARRWLIAAAITAIPYSLVTVLLYVARFKNSPTYTGQPIVVASALAIVLCVLFFGSYIWFFNRPHVVAQFKSP